MTIACPYCRAQVVLDATGTSACGHLRGGMDTVTGLPVPGLGTQGPGAPRQPWVPQPAPHQAPPWAPTRPAPRKGGGKGCGCIGLAGLAIVLVIGAILLLGDGLPFGPGPAGSPQATPVQSLDPGFASLPPATTPLTGEVTAGQPVRAATGTAKAGKATTIAVPPGRRGEGLSIVIPKGAYEGPVEFTIGVAPMRIDGFNGRLTPVSDLVTVENGGAYAAVPMRVTVPIALQDGWFALGFYLHEDGSIEPMPVLAESATSITVATRHFSSFFIAAVEAALLPDEVGTGFRAGEDDFTTPNYGSVVAKGGHCVGQSVAALWYFLNRKAAGEPQLHGRYDNLDRTPTPAYWRDDATVIRLSSTLQREAGLTAWAEVQLDNLVRADNDRLQWDAFRFALMVTGEPQLVGLYETGKPGGHEIIVYAVTRTGLWVADPNLPGGLRSIDWDAAKGRFVPYASGDNAATSNHHYDVVGFDAQWALFNPGDVAAAWEDADDGVAGFDRFPSVTVQVAWQQADGTYDYEALESGPLDTNRPLLGAELDTALNVPVRIVVLSGTEVLDHFPQQQFHYVTIPYGVVDLGVLVEAQVVTPTADDPGWRWVDFQRFDVVAPAPSGMASVAPEPTGAPAETDDGIDCSATPPPGIAGVKWSLKCGGSISNP